MSDQFEHQDLPVDDSPVEEETRTMPIGVGEFDFQGDGAILGEEEKKSKISAGTLLVFLFILLAAGGLYSMRFIASAMAGQLASDEKLESTIDIFITKLGAENGEGLNLDNGSEVAAIINDVRTKKHVPLDRVQKNPFVLNNSGQPSTTENNNDPKAQEKIRLAKLRQEEKVYCENAASKFRIVMILDGGNPMANVSGNPVRKGDSLIDEESGIEFKVIEIKPSMVKLRYQKKEINFTFETVLLLNPDS